MRTLKIMETYGLDIGDSVFLAHSLLHLFVGYYFWSITILTVFFFYSFLKLIFLQLFNYFFFTFLFEYIATVNNN